MCRWHGTLKASLPVAAQCKASGAGMLSGAGGCSNSAEQPQLCMGHPPQGASDSSIWYPSAAGKWLALAISCIHDAAWLVIAAADQSSHSKVSIYNNYPGANVPLLSLLLAQFLSIRPAQPSITTYRASHLNCTCRCSGIACCPSEGRK